MDLLLSITVSLPTSRRPICLGSILYFARSEVTAVKLQIKHNHISKIEESVHFNHPYNANLSHYYTYCKTVLRDANNI